MANNSGNPNAAAFPGFPGGHDIVPGVGNVPAATVGGVNTGSGGIPVLGANLPVVNPNTFQGTVHWGPQQTMTGPPPIPLQPATGTGGTGSS